MIFAKVSPVCVDYRTYEQLFTQGIKETGPKLPATGVMNRPVF